MRTNRYSMFRCCPDSLFRNGKIMPPVNLT